MPQWGVAFWLEHGEEVMEEHFAEKSAIPDMGLRRLKVGGKSFGAANRSGKAYRLNAERLLPRFQKKWKYVARAAVEDSPGSTPGPTSIVGEQIGRRLVRRE